MVILRGPGGTDMWKKPEIEISVIFFMLVKSHDFNSITLDGINNETENLPFTINGFALFFNYFLLVSIISKATEHFLVINPLYKHYSHN